MRVKDHYSLCVEELIGAVPMAENLPTNFDGGISVPIIQKNYAESLCFFEAFADYLVERSRTQDIEKQFAAAEEALDSRNAEARLQSATIIANYAERLKGFVESRAREFELETQRLEAESAERVEIVRNEREREHFRITELIQVLEHYRTFLVDSQKFLAEIEQCSEKFATKNKFYFRVKKDYDLRLKWIQKLLNKIDN